MRKSSATAAVCASLLVGGAVIEESRISKLKQQVESLEQKLNSPDSSVSIRPDKVASSEPAAPSRSGSPMPAPEAEAPAEGKTAKNGGFGETMRKIYQNKAGRAMIREDNRRRADSIYKRLIGSLDLSSEEEEHFLDLLAPSVGEQDRVGMAMFNAENDEQRLQLIDDMEKAQADRREAIKTFLNDDQDFAEYEEYHARKSEYEQISSINSVMQDIGSPMSPDQEAELIEAMYSARTETGITERWEGREGFYQFGEPEPSKRFADDWALMQANLDGRVSDILDKPQQEALTEHQNQIEQFVLMGLNMAESMMKSAGKQPAGN